MNARSSRLKSATSKKKMGAREGRGGEKCTLNIVKAHKRAAKSRREHVSCLSSRNAYKKCRHVRRARRAQHWQRDDLQLAYERQFSLYSFRLSARTHGTVSRRRLTHMKTVSVFFLSNFRNSRDSVGRDVVFSWFYALGFNGP